MNMKLDVSGDLVAQRDEGMDVLPMDFPEGGTSGARTFVALREENVTRKTHMEISRDILVKRTKRRREYIAQQTKTREREQGGRSTTTTTESR